MNQVFHLYRRPEDTSGLRSSWNYSNRIASAEGDTLYVGSTPNGFFKSATTFKDQTGRDTLVFGANRSIAPSAFITSNSEGCELFRIELPGVARLRTRASMQLFVAANGDCFELVPSHVATGNELTRLVAVLQEEFVVKHDGITVGYTGQFDPENEDEGSGGSAARRLAGSLLSDIAKIPGNIVKLRKGVREDRLAGQLTIASQHACAKLALTLLVFRAYIYKDLQSPQEAWWQGD